MSEPYRVLLGRSSSQVHRGGRLLHRAWGRDPLPRRLRSSCPSHRAVVAHITQPPANLERFAALAREGGRERGLMLNMLPPISRCCGLSPDTE